MSISKQYSLFKSLGTQLTRPYREEQIPSNSGVSMTPMFLSQLKFCNSELIDLFLFLPSARSWPDHVPNPHDDGDDGWRLSLPSMMPAG
jgi:hypothetical protein